MGGIGRALRPAPRPRRFAPAHRRNRPGGPALARLGPPGHSIRPRTFNYLYISRRIGAHLQAGSPSAFIAQATLPLSLALPHSPSSNSSRRRGSLPKEERPPPGPPAFRAGNPLGDRPWSILYVGVFPSLRYLRSLGATAYSNAQAFPPRPILHMYAEAPLASFLKPKRRELPTQPSS